jgi:predicted Ser/Thr protein kinase
MVGRTLGHFRVIEKLGEGGMGEVYRAKDAKLGRDVAIKVLPDEFAQDDERLRRFQREAKLLASLNHPNIASIYGLEQSGETHYLILELVPGETLADRIARAPIPVDEALEIGAKIADALEEAHEQGIVHRDLKPANIKLTEDGKVIVLDFGLAKAFVDERADADSSMSPTITRDVTRVGVILGTAAYMSPEQAKGKRVDRRTDIFAFGAVLYEMLTRRKAFPGDDVSEVLAAVIKSEPAWSRLPQPRLRPVLERCLRKDVRSRYHHIADARLALAEAAHAPASEAVSRPKAELPWALAVLMALVAGLAVWTSRPSDRATRAPVRLSLNLEHGLGTLDAAILAISPDGTRVVHKSGAGPLYVRELGRDEWTPIPGTEGAQTPFFSPNGNWLGFVTAGKLMKVQLEGAGAAVIAEGLSSHGASWGPDDAIVFTAGTELMRIPAVGGSPEALTPKRAPDPSAGRKSCPTERASSFRS